MKLAENIRVIADAIEAGKVLEVFVGNWIECSTYFAALNYIGEGHVVRVKPEPPKPREVWIAEDKHGTRLHDHHSSKELCDASWGNLSVSFRPVCYREVLE